MTPRWPSNVSPFESSAAETPAEDRPGGSYKEVPRPAPSGRSHLELRRASLICGLERATKLVREDRIPEARIEVMRWLRLYEEEA